MEKQFDKATVVCTVIAKNGELTKYSVVIKPNGGPETARTFWSKRTEAEIIESQYEQAFKAEPKIAPGVYIMQRDYRFKFGKFRGVSVQELINKGLSGITYIVWAYANKPDIDFAEDVIAEIGCERVAKPGSDPDVYARFIERLSNNDASRHEIYKLAAAARKRGIERRWRDKVDIMARQRDYKENGKGALQWKNQGH